MKSFMNDKKTYNKLSKKALKRYEEKYSVKSVVDKMTEIYETAVATTTDDDKNDEDFWGDMWE